MEPNLPSLLTAGHRAVFHGVPGRAIGPMRSAVVMAGRRQQPVEAASATWLLGVALGAVGRYGAALRSLLPLVAAGEDQDGPVVQTAELRRLAALAAATAASLHRQIGRHAPAGVLDRRGLALTDGSGKAAFDCTLGLAADAVGLGDAVTASTRRDQAAVIIPVEAGWWRQRVRLDWVRAEVALLTEQAPAAVQTSHAAVGRSEQAGAPRHRAKSLLFLGVAQRQVGDVRAEASLLQAAMLAETLGCLPLVWPAHAVLAALVARSDPEASRRHRRAARTAARQIAADLPDELRGRWLASPDVAALMID